VDGDGVGRVAKCVNFLELSGQKETAISPQKEQEKKRPRRNGDGEEGNAATTNIRSALSFEESGWAQ